MRVAQLVTRPSEEGSLAALAVHELAEGLARLGVAVDVLRPQGDDLVGYDLVHAHGSDALDALALRGAMPGRVVVSARPAGPHPLTIRRMLRRPRGGAPRALLAGAEAIICPSAADARLIVRDPGIDPRRVRVVPEGIDIVAIDRAQAFRLAAPVVVADGQLDAIRQFGRLIGTLSSLDDDVRLVLLGDWPRRRTTAALAAELGVGARVVSTGRVTPASRYRWLKTARVVLALSEGSGSPQTLLEAVRAGRPVVATDTVAHREMAVHAPPAAVSWVPVGASPLRLADAIEDAGWDGTHAEGVPAPPARAEFAARMLAVYRTVVLASDGPTPASGIVPERRTAPETALSVLERPVQRPRERSNSPLLERRRPSAR